MTETTTLLIERVLTLMPDASVIVDDAGVIISSNALAEALFGYEHEGLAGRAIEVLIPERHRSRHRSHRDQYRLGPTPRTMGVRLELSGRRRDGSEFPVDVSLAPLTDEGRSFVVATIRDTTERVAATEASAHLAAIVRGSTDAMITMERNGTVTSWNLGAVRLFGYGTDEMLGRHVSELVPSEESGILEDLLAAVVDGSYPAPHDTQWRVSSGALLPIAISVSPFERFGDRLFGFSVLAWDISERKHAEGLLRRQDRWLSGMAEIRLAMLSSVELTEVLSLICAGVLKFTDADAAGLLEVSGESGTYLAASGALEGAVGSSLSDLPPGVVEAAGTGATTFGTASDDLGGAEGADGPTVIVPVRSGRMNAVLLAVGGSVADAEILPLVEGLAAQAALAFQLAEAKQDSERALLAEDRERIARDLHDLVIQRLFGAGMALQGLLAIDAGGSAAGRLNAVIDDLDETIREIRTTIFALESRYQEPSSVRREILQLASEASVALGFEPTVRFDGPIDALAADIRPELEAVVREALSNVARHAAASHVVIELSATNDELTLFVIDDGVGVGQIEREGGVGHMRARAERLQGTSSVARGLRGGTRVEWRVPITTVASRSL